MSFRPLQIRWQSEGLATTSDSTTRAIPPWLYSATRSLRWGIGDGVGYGVPKLQIRPGHSQRKPLCSSLQGWDFGRVSGASLWRPYLSHRPIFMHEGPTPHTARISMAFLRQSAMEVLPWPSLSPDLNPIEYVWGYIRRHLNEMDPLETLALWIRRLTYRCGIWRHTSWIASRSSSNDCTRGLCRKLTKHLLYHIANFDGGTQCVMWGVICIFMKSTGCKLTSHKKLTFGVAKTVLVSTLLFKDYKVIFTHFCQTCYQVYTHRIDNFSGSHSMSNTMKNKFGKFLQELFSRGVYRIRTDRTHIHVHILWFRNMYEYSHLRMTDP